MLDKELIQRKLDQITDYLEDLEKLAQKSHQEFLGSVVHLAAERLIELIVGNAIDINFHIIKEFDLPAPIKYRDSFVTLGKHKILPFEFSRKIAGSAGLRNLLIHEYEEVDLNKLYNGLKSGIEDYKHYVKEIYHQVFKENKGSQS